MFRPPFHSGILHENYVKCAGFEWKVAHLSSLSGALSGAKCVQYRSKVAYITVENGVFPVLYPLFCCTYQQ